MISFKKIRVYLEFYFFLLRKCLMEVDVRCFKWPNNFVLQESQEERKQCLRHVLPARHPGVQGSLRHHGRRQGLTLNSISTLEDLELDRIRSDLKLFLKLFGKVFWMIKKKTEKWVGCGHFPIKEMLSAYVSEIFQSLIIKTI